MNNKICNCCEVETIPQSEDLCAVCVEYCEHLGLKKNKFQALNMHKIYDSYSKKIWECSNTKMKIEHWKYEKLFVLFDEDNMIVWEFNSFKEAKQAAKDYIFSTN